MVTVVSLGVVLQYANDVLVLPKTDVSRSYEPAHHSEAPPVTVVRPMRSSYSKSLFHGVSGSIQN